jgi:predicted Zn-dependent peptidase
MKKQLIILFFSAFTIAGIAQERDVKVFDRSNPPEPGPAPKIEVGSYESFTLDNGLEVFVVEDKDVATVSFQLSLLKNGPISEGDKAGIGSITAELMENGTKNRTATELEDEIDYIAANIFSYEGGAFGSGLKEYQDKIMELMSDIVLNPSFPEDKLTKIKRRTISGLLADGEDPNVIASKVVRNVNYTPDSPYGEQTTATTISNIQLEDCKEYYDKYYKPNAGYLVMVGNINVEEARELATKYLNSWEKGEVKKNTDVPPGPVPDNTKIMLVDRETSEQSIINITYPINDMKPGTDDALTGSVMNTILGGGSARLFNNLREDKGYTYGAYSSMSPSEYVGQFSASASVRNEVTGDALKEFLYEMERMKTEEVPEDELEFNINKVAGSFARSLESPQTVANFAVNTAQYDLPSDYYATYLQRLREITPDDIKASAEKYIRPENANIVIVGKGDDIREQIAEYGEILEYRKDGTLIEKVNLDDLTIEDKTAEEIVGRFVDAIGGADKMKAIQTMVINASSQQGEFNMIRKGDDKALNSLISGEKRVFSVTLNGDDAGGFTSSGKIGFDLSLIEKLKYSVFLNEEVYYDQWKVKMKLKDVADVDGKACYEVRVSIPSGDKVTKYYDASTGLLVREKSSFKGTRSYDNYKEVNGVLIPHKISFEKDPFYGTFSAIITKIEVNTDVSDLYFKVGKNKEFFEYQLLLMEL